jgi:hypothetical protein
LRVVDKGLIIDAIMLRIIVCRPCQTHVHCLDVVDNVMYDVMHKLINFSIIGSIMGRASPGVT